MNIVKINISNIKPYWRNPRENQKGIKPLIESIKSFGFTTPITVDKDNVIITGHTRYKAVLNLQGNLTEHIKKLKENGNSKLATNLEPINNGFIYAIVRDDLSPAKIKEYRITDNKIGELSDWDVELLKYELRELENITGFTDEEIDKILNDEVLFNKYTDDDVLKAEEDLNAKFKEISKRGDLIEIKCPFCNKSYSLSKRELLHKNYYV